MPLVPIDLPTPPQLRPRWAALAAISAARSDGHACHADVPGVWRYDDGGGNWIELHQVSEGRAVLLGHDHEASETYYGEAASVFDQPETDLLAGAPAWWGPPVRRTLDGGAWVGFVYGFDGAAWQRADYTAEDGFGSIRFPALGDEETLNWIYAQVEGFPGLPEAAQWDAAAGALIAADAEVTPAHITAVIGPQSDDPARWDTAAGVAAAHRFLTM
ncbi:proteophosphoglycan 5 [Streptomyces luteolus]|uniref:Proteophosphoglycan 5 n=1 Tax=Streptomyces luteolus TaxID=3043615 RepID=A0ABT6SWK1_9ACTN|nr:proteophosphoglycan 5 [Streptomyces sp. B-S-A12]MDI3419969.1 proteophosphoglycan 5 [Streptomyces sp. B-S-A12]